MSNVGPHTKLEMIKQYIVQDMHLIVINYPTTDGCSCYKGSDCKSAGKHPRDTDWTTCDNHITTFEQAQRVWGEEGNYKWNVGVVTGDCSNVVVIDVDGERGKESLKKLIADTGQDLTLTRTHKTGSGGLHLLFENPTTIHLTNSNKNLKAKYPNIDIRGNGGQIVVAPSMSPKGDYSIINDNPILKLSQGLLDVIKTPVEVTRTAALREDVQASTELPEPIQEACELYANRALSNELERFTTEYNMNGWDDLVNEVSFITLVLANSPWNSLSKNAVVQQLFDSAPRGGDSEWDDERIMKCINSAFGSVTQKDIIRDIPDSIKSDLEALQAEIANPTAPTGWDYEDIDAVLSDNYEPLQPSMLTCENGVSLLYPGKVHSIAGESGSGKSMVAFAAVAQELLKGNRVLILDFESDLGTVVRERLLDTFKVPAAVLKANLRYIRPETKPAPGTPAGEAFKRIVAEGYDLVVVDGVTTSVGIWGGSGRSEDDVTIWNTEFLFPFERIGSTVLLIDHVTKNKETRGAYAIGSQAKKSVLTGAGYILENLKPFGRGLKGVAQLSIMKDRNGSVERHAGKGRIICRFTLDSTDETNPVYKIENFNILDANGNQATTSDNDKRNIILSFIRNNAGSTKGEILNCVPGNTTAKAKIIQDLMSEELIYTEDQGSGKAKLHFVSDQV